MDDDNMAQVETLVNLLKTSGKEIVGVDKVDIDEDIASYLLELLRAANEDGTMFDAQVDVRPFLCDMYGKEIPDDKCDNLVDEICRLVLKTDGLTRSNEKTDQNPATTEKLSSVICSAEANSDDPLDVSAEQDALKPVIASQKRNTLIEDTDSTTKQSKAKLRAAKRAEQKRLESAARVQKQQEEAELAAAEEAAAANSDDKKWSTKRFQRFHETWVGKGNWKVHDHAISLNVDELDDDDYSSAWLECLRLGIPWGGRGAGGRGVARITGETKDVHVNNVTMARGIKQLLVGATLKLVRGHRYGLVGRNGVGKTTLLRRIALGTLPGFPPWLRVQHVQQEIPPTDDTPVEYALRYDHERSRLLEEQAKLLNSTPENTCTTRSSETSETHGNSPKESTGTILDQSGGIVDGNNSESNNVIEPNQASSAEIATRLAEIHEQLELIDAWNAPERALTILKELGFSNKQCESSCRSLSGGWLMRVGLAGALLMNPDILVLDEPTNHLDLQAISWLQNHLLTCDQIVLFVSHDRNFLNTVATDIIDFRNKQLFYFPGNLDEFEQRLAEKRAGQARKLDAQQKQKAHMQSYIDTQRAAAKDKKTKGGDVKKQQQIRSKVLRMEKLGRIMENGKRVKQSYGIHTELAYDVEEKPASFALHPCAELVTSGPIVQLSQVSFRYPTDDGSEGPWVLQDCDLQLWSNSKIGVLGNNGQGKSTLMKLITKQVQPTIGQVTSHHNLKIGYFAQDIVNDLDKDKTPAEVIMELRSGMTMLEARKHLGTVGLAGDLALSKVGTLSGGQKSRVAFAQQTFGQPHLLILDEPTNHLDMSTIEALGESVRNFNGCVLVVSHDVAFLKSSCRDLWGVANGRVKVCVQSFEKSSEESEELKQLNRDKFHDALYDFLATQAD